MLLDQNPELQISSSRPRTLIVSIAVHAVLLVLLAFNPGWFDSTPRRTIRIAGEDFDLSQLQIQPLYLPPIQRAPATQAPPPVPAPTPQVVQPTPPQAAPPPLPPPPPPPQPSPNQVIRPDDLLAEGARPDGSPRVSRGNTDQLRNGANAAQQAQQAQQAQEALDEQRARQAQARGQSGNDRVLPNNTNRNALQAPLPSLLSSAGRIVDGQLDAARRSNQPGRTGIARSDNYGTFSTDSQVEILSPNPKGIDFGPYLNQLLTRLRANWYSVMPEMARLGQKGRVDVVFTVTRSGIVKDVQIVANSNYDALDKGAVSAIQLSNPFQHLPAEYETDLKLHIGFLYNMNP